MKRLISTKLAGRIMLVILSLMALLHLLILLKVIPADFVWGGRLGEPSNIIAMELVALVITLLFAVTVLARRGYIFQGRAGRTVRVGMWLICAYFAFNTFTNLASSSGLA